MATQTLEQERAEFSYNCVKEIASNTDDLIPKKKFKGLVKKTPTYILTNGLGNTIAFLFSKGNNEHLALVYIIGKYLFEINDYTNNILRKNNLNFYTEIDSVLGFIKYQQDLKKTLSLLEKLKREIKSLENKLKENKQKKEEVEKELEDKKEKYRVEINQLEIFKEKHILTSEIINNIRNMNFSKDDVINSVLINPVFQSLVFTDTDKYILATEETLRLLNWLRRFVEAMIEGEE